MHGHLCLAIHCIRHKGDPEPRAHRELFIAPREVDRLVTTLKAEGYRFTLPSEAAKGEGRACCITFDDGYYNNRHFLETAEKHEIPFILFLNSYNVLHRVPFIWDIWEATRKERWCFSSADYVSLYGRLSPGEREILQTDAHRPFSPEELADFVAHPLAHLGPHGHTHQPLVGRYGDRMEREIEDNLAFLSGYPRVLKDDFALPCGLSTAGARRRLLRRFERIYTIDGSTFSLGDRVIHRISLINPEYGGDLREQIQRSFRVKDRLVRKAMTIRYSNRLLCRL